MAPAVSHLPGAVVTISSIRLFGQAKLRVHGSSAKVRSVTAELSAR
jgi:hypothetical protein